MDAISIYRKNRLSNSDIQIPTNDSQPFKTMKNTLQNGKKKFEFKGIEETNSSSSNSSQKSVLYGAALQEHLKRKQRKVNYAEPLSEIDIPLSQVKSKKVSSQAIQKQKQKSPPTKKVYSKEKRGKTVIREERKELGLRTVTSKTYNESSDEETPKKIRKKNDETNKIRKKIPDFDIEIPIKLGNFQGSLVDFVVSDVSDDEVIDITNSDSLCMLQSSQDILDPCPVDRKCKATFKYPLSEPLSQRLDSFERIKKLYEKGIVH
jgi:hypothetical protein